MSNNFGESVIELLYALLRSKFETTVMPCGYNCVHRLTLILSHGITVKIV